MFKKTLVLFSFLTIATVMGGCHHAEKITNFQECIDAGNPAMESYPRQCQANGETFTEEIGEPFSKNEMPQINEESCKIDDDCELPMDYALRSDCPYEAKCINQKCDVICPKF